MPSLNKEQIYDQQIAPLVEQIINICKEHGIAMLADFVLPTPDEPDLRCTTMLEDESRQVDPRHHMALNILGINTSTMTMTITSEHPDGSKQVTAIL